MIELELSSNAWQAFEYVSTNTPGFASKDVYLHATAYEVDSSISNSLSEHIAGGEPLPYHLTTVYSTKHFLTQPDFSIQLQRSASRLKQVNCVIHHGNATVPDGSRRAYTDDRHFGVPAYHRHSEMASIERSSR